jgi:hypothetical protein
MDAARRWWVIYVFGVALIYFDFPETSFSRICWLGAHPISLKHWCCGVWAALFLAAARSLTAFILQSVTAMQSDQSDQI